MGKKKPKYALEGDATYKQTWSIAHDFAKQSASLFPGVEKKNLAFLFNGTIYHYHENLGKKLSKKEASEFITNKPPVPQYYIDALVAHLEKPTKTKNPSTNNTPDPLAELMRQDLDNLDDE
jgi:hypothetical protein